MLPTPPAPSSPTRPRARSAAGVALLAAAVLLGTTAWAEKADRNQPLVVEADKGGSIDLQRQVLVYTGNVLVAQGSMQLRAERIEMRQGADGYRTALAQGSTGKPATWRQKRDGVDETVEGWAERIEFDAKADTLRLLGRATVRRLRGATVADEITGSNILWDNGTEVFKVEGGNATVSNPTGRVRAVLSPQGDNATKTEVAPAGGTPLTPSRSLGDKR